MKICTKCRASKEESEFGFDNRYIYRSQCRECERVTMRRAKVRHAYDVSLEWIENRSIIQNGACSICKIVTDLEVDHCHKTGKVRELLCRRCNRQVLGFANHDPELLRRAASYLEKHNE